MKQRRTKKEPSLKKPVSALLVERYKAFSYRLFGKHVFTTEKTGALSEKLKMANMRYTPSVFYSTLLTTGILITVLSLIVFSFLFHFLLTIDMWLLYSLALTAVTTTVTLGMFFFVMNSKISSRKSQIDHELPFVLSELSILASTGLTPIKIMRHMAQRHGNPAMTSEFRKIISKIDVEGKDIITAMSETAKETPSPLFRETLWDLCNMIHQGGDLDAYLRSKADITLQLKRDIQKEFIEKLATYSEMYSSLVLIGVLFLGIAAFLLDAMQSTIGPLTADSLLLMLSYLIIPAVIIGVNAIVSLAYAKSG
ncbi:MAG: type II secretion system F family protein [Candidatus Thermoplasmatota archaeon]|nr:type II secretion system F family protein [Candidatus Thermoplasmatota archaeon]